MRTIDAGQDRILSLRNRSVHLRIEVDRDGAGTFQELTDLSGFDFVQSASWREGVDKPVATATVKLFRERYDLRLAPLVGASKFNQPGVMLEVNRTIRIRTATLGKDQLPVDADFELMFEGKIDVVDWGGTEAIVTLQARDLGGELQDEFVEDQTNHGNGVDQLDVVIQDVLDTHVTTTAPTLLVATAPAFVIDAYSQNKQPVMQAIRVLAQLIGFDVRYRFDSAGGDFRLTLIEPDRTSPSVDREFDADDYDDIVAVKVSRINVRNFIRVVISIIDDADAGSPGEGVRTQVTATDAASITRYGRRFMEIAEAGSSPINSVVEAQRMADGALSDLKEPGIDHQARQDYFWPIQLGDFYRYKANGIHYDVDQELAVIQYTHNVTEGVAKTTIMLRGVPSSGVKRWLQLDGGRPGIAPATDRKGPALPGISCDVGVGSITIIYDEPADPDWKTTEVYLSTASFVANFGEGRPDPTLLVAVGRQNRFDITGLVPGTEVFVRVIVVDVKGNFFIATDIVQDVPERAAAFHQSNESDRLNMIPNGDFGQVTRGTTVPPDGWEVFLTAGGNTWNGTEIGENLILQESGTRSIQFKDQGLAVPATITTQFRSINSTVGGTAAQHIVPIERGVLYRMSWVVRATRLQASGVRQIRLTFNQFDKDKANLGGTVVFFEVNAVDVFERFESYEYAGVFGGVEARYFGISCVKSTFAGEDDFDLFLDRMDLRPARQSFEAFLLNNTAVAANLDVPPPMFEFFDIGGENIDGTEFGYDPVSGKYTVFQNGQYGFECAFKIEDLIAANTMEVGFLLNGVRVKVGEFKTSPLTRDMQCTARITLDLVKGQFVQAFVNHSNVPTRVVLGGRANTYFSGGRIE